MYYSNFTKTILSAAEQSIPRIKHKKIRKQSGNPWWNKFSIPKKGKIQEMVKDKTEENSVCMEKCKSLMQQSNSGSQKVLLD